MLLQGLSWRPPFVTCSTYTGEGIVELIMHMTCLDTGGHLEERQIAYNDKQTFAYLKAELQITWFILTYCP